MEDDLMFSNASSSPLTAAVSARDSQTLKMVDEAIESRNAVLAYQPIMLARDQRRAAFYEGLVRILDQGGRVIPARDFIDVVETHELGRRIDCISLELGLTALRRVPSLRLAINMSARSIGYRRWRQILDSGLHHDPTVAERLILEINESSAMIMPDVVQPFMSDLHGRGVSFALDDFGAGFTSLQHLRDMFFDIVKIDGGLIQGIAKDVENQVLVRSLVTIGQNFDMLVVAEKVETEEDAQFLAGIGIDCLQGYYFGTPKRRLDFDNSDKRRAAG